MRKILSLTMLALFACITINCHPQPITYEYSLRVTGDAVGVITITTPNGDMTLNGDGIIQFSSCSDNPVLDIESCQKDGVLVYGTQEEINIMLSCAQYANDNFNAVCKSGSCLLTLHAYVYDITTDSYFEWEKVVDNRSRSGRSIIMHETEILESDKFFYVK